MNTFGDMVEETRGYLRAFVRDQELSTHLVAACDGTSVSLKVNDPTVVSRGRVEIDEELIWVDKADKASGLASVPPYGRGMDGTAAVPHAAGARVVMQPLYPTKFVKDTLNQAILSVGSQLYGVSTFTFTPSVRTDVYELPADVRDVLSVKEVDPQVTDNKVTYLREWTLDKHAPVNSGKGLYLSDHFCYGNRSWVEVVYSSDPMPLVGDGQSFSDSLLPETAWDVVVMLAASRLLASADAGKVQTRSIEANTLDSRVPLTAAGQQAKYLYTQAQQRLMDERQRLLNTTVTRSHYAR